MKYSLRLITGLLFVLFFSTELLAQKKQLDHSVYDSWQSIGEKKISANGVWVAYSIDVQEGDGIFVIQRSDDSYKMEIPRGYAASFSDDDKFLILKIKPLYQDTRQARIKKKKAEDFPKDSLAIVNLESRNIEKIPKVSSYKIPEKAPGWIAYQLSNNSYDSIIKKSKDSVQKKVDTSKVIIPQIIEQSPDKKQKRKLSGNTENDTSSIEDADADDNGKGPIQEGFDLIVRNLNNGKQFKQFLVNKYQWSENGKMLLMESSVSKSNKSIKPAVFIWRSIENRYDTLLVGGNDFKNFVIDKDGYQIAFVAERDSSFKSLQKFYKLWYWRNGDKEAKVLADRYSEGMKLNWTISENAVPEFSKGGKRLFIGTTPVKSIRDTSLIEMDLAKLDVWHYNDDYLQPYQLRTAEMENRRSYLAMIDLDDHKLTQLADPQVPQVITSNDGDGSTFIGVSDKGKRISMQWVGGTLKDVFHILPKTGERKLIQKDLDGMPMASPHGKYIIWYDQALKNYYSYVDGKVVNISKSINQKLYNEEYDMPSTPDPYGIMRWAENDASLMIYDRYDIWQLDPSGMKPAINITAGVGRKQKTSYKFIITDPEEKVLKNGQQILLRSFNELNKHAGISTMKIGDPTSLKSIQSGSYSIGQILKAKSSEAYVYTKETYVQSPDLHFSTDLSNEKKMSSINAQQSLYNWGTAELFNWKAYNGKAATGIVYKPENFDPKKKYPMIAYFYETLSDGLFNYMAPSPTPSRLNIPFFVSRGYIVLAPDIHYTTGYPGKAAVDYVVSGARALVKKGWVDSTKMGIQGQSWGGYQVAHIITRTNLFSAAWAGAPVANMTSAYGGIRWESGMNRQFQYEKTQSRIGATLWEKPNLYIENSPLFHLKNVKTPLVIMSNDADGAVPWYQGIEMFTAMRRLDKKVWLLNYNGEAHNLVERRNRKDIQIREQQFFDWLLKGEKPTVWITDGIPATEKGKTWGFDTKLD